VLDVLVERIVGAEPALDRDELALRVALEGDEEEAGFELAEALVDAVGEGVAAAQDPLAPVGLGRGEADVGVDRDRRVAVGLGVERQRFELVDAAERGAAVLARPIVRSWSRSEERSQISSSMRMRRVTM
jgi:hypothetical protein